MSIGLRTLVLHADYTPVSLFPLYTIPAEDAIRRVLEKTATQIADHRPILTQNHTLKWPSVIVNKRTYRRRQEVLLRHETLYYRDHGICAYCEKELRPSNITCDHVIPRHHGGHHGWDNVVACCQKCNAEKADKLPRGIWKPKITPYKPTLGELMARRRKFPISVANENWMDYLGPWEGAVHIASG